MANEEYTELVQFIGRRFDQVDERLDGMDQRLAGMNQRLDGMDQRLDGMDQRFDGMDERLKKVLVTVEENRNLIQTVAAGVTSMNRKLDDFREDVDRRFREHRELLWTSHGFLDHRVTALESRVDRLEADA